MISNGIIKFTEIIPNVWFIHKIIDIMFNSGFTGYTNLL
jgi:hypothetical protein